MSGGANYPKVIDLLADTIKELNRPCVAAVPAAERSRSAAERKRDAADVLRVLLHQLDQGGAADGGAAAAAEHSASADKTNWNWNWLSAFSWLSRLTFPKFTQGQAVRQHDKGPEDTYHVIRGPMWEAETGRYYYNLHSHPNFEPEEGNWSGMRRYYEDELY